MKKLLGWLGGTVTLQVAGEGLEGVLNRCAQGGISLATMRRQGDGSLLLQVSGLQWPRLRRLLGEGTWEVTVTGRRGLPYFLLHFRRRYALLAGLVLCLVAFAAGARTVLTIDVTGNVTVPTQVILSQLRLCGVSVGTYAPGIPIREVENNMMLAMNELSFFSLNIHGTRAEVIVRERDPAPALREENVASNVVSAATGVVTHIEPWVGDAQVQVGQAVCEGDVLISGYMQMDTPTPLEGEMEPMLVHAEGKVLARTWRTLTARIPLTARGKVYTGEETTHYSLSVLGKRLKFYQNGSIPYENYDTISKLKSWSPLGTQGLPILWQAETYRAYETQTVTLDPAAAEELLREKLLEALTEQLDQGEILQTDYTVTCEGDTLQVTLLAQCDEQIGRVVPMEGVEGEIVGPRHPAKEDLDRTTEDKQGED